MSDRGINLARKLATFSEHYRPRTVGTFNGHDLMVVKLTGTPNTGDPRTAAPRTEI